MLALIVVTGASAAVPAVAGVTPIAVQPLAGDRTGVVVDWRPRSGTAVVAMPSGRLRAIHSLRKVTPGTRVRVEGIKWGAPTSGIKWSVAPQGIKWGIKWSRNGSYSSNLRRVGRAARTPLRGVVVRRFGGGAAIGTPGGLVVVRMAVWLPKTGKARTNGVVLPKRGDVITTNVAIGRRGRLHGDGARILGTGSAIPVSGRLAVVDTAQRTVRIANITDPSFPVSTELGVPSTIDMTRLTVGREVAATASPTADGTLRVDTIAANETFAAGNDPANNLVAPPSADADTLGLLRKAIDRWTLGRTKGEITDQAIYDADLARLMRAEAAAVDGNLPVARAEVDAFINDVTAALPVKVHPTVAVDVLALTSAAFDHLG
jgi:hypothetical protein